MINIPKIVLNDAYLKPYQKTIRNRQQQVLLKAFEFTAGEKTLANCFNGHLYFGLHKLSDGWVFREWAPNATQIYIIGDFNGWQKDEKYRLQKNKTGVWERYFDENAIKNEQLYKLLIEWGEGSGERLPAYVRRVIQDDKTKLFAAQVWDKDYVWKHENPKNTVHPFIYEVHIGMASSEERPASYKEFKDNVLPRIVATGYNTIQIMAVQEHPYYGSFGYQVSNFFAASSRFGTPEELKELIDEAHKNNITVILDVIHSHAVKNELEGLAKFDGTETQYFYEGERGNHPLWDSKCFDYGRNEVVHFLLSNLKYWLEEFHFDGFRFDGVTSMLYWHHGMGTAFTDYSMYFNGAQDENAITYLALANKLIHEINPNAITIAEDVSGYPGLASAFEEGGIGFDFRMSMGVPDYWIKTLKEKTDQQWNVSSILYELTNKRKDEKVICYAESHDQAMVGDKTIMFRLADKEMYTSMSIHTPSLIIDRAIALHKMIRLVTMSTAGGGYLTFMGNEFGHPEWIDFPREGNGWSYKYARRQWQLVDDKLLKYRFLLAFEKIMLETAKKYQILDYYVEPLTVNEEHQILAFRRGKLIFIFNFNPEKSFTDYIINTNNEEKYKLLFSSDDAEYGGFSRLTSHQSYANGNRTLRLYLPTRTVIVLVPQC